jgi:maleate cis-trans isomerase
MARRHRIGVVLPSNNVVLEPEFWACLPAGVSAHFSRMLAEGGDAEALERMARQAPRALRELTAGGMDIYLYACFSTSLARRPGWDERFVSSCESSTGRPCRTAGLATVAALKACRVHKVSVVSPYVPEMHGRIAGFFGRHGLEVVADASLNIADLRAVGEVDQSESETLVRSTVSPGAEGVCILATDLPTLAIIQPLEASLGIPVVSTNQALLWTALRTLGYRGGIGIGALFNQ